MRIHAAVLTALALAGCASLPDTGLPSGTYRDEGGTGDAIVVDGDELTVYLPALQSGRRIGSDGRTFTYQTYADGFLRLSSSSNDAYFLDLIRFCDWRWNSPAIECRRESQTVVRFTRETSGAAVTPALPQQQVWLAVAQRVRAHDAPASAEPRALSVFHRTSFPKRRESLSQLDKQARRGFCGLPRDEADGVVRSLDWQNKRTHSIGDLFDHRPEFEVVTRRSDKGGQLGLSDVVFTRDGETAYLNADIGGAAGSIVKMRKKDGAWTWDSECATWTTD
jgi:hypothetical protein